MNFPLDNPLYRFLYWLINTPSVGGIFAFLVLGGLVSIFVVALVWVLNGSRAAESETYTYPTSSLIDH